MGLNAFSLLAQASAAPEYDTFKLVSVLVLSIVIILVLILKFRIQAFVTLLLAAIFVGIASGTMSITDVGSTIQDGMGGALGFIATIIGLGAIFGQMIDHSGGAQSLANGMLRTFGEKRANWAMLLTGFIISVPVFLDVGVVILAPIIYALARRSGKSVLVFALPLLAGMAVTHAFVPPTPGPTFVAFALGVPLGFAIMWGVIVGLPTALVTIPVCRILGTKFHIDPPDPDEEPSLGEDTDEAKGPGLPSVWTILLILGGPIFLIVIGSIVESSIASGITDEEIVERDLGKGKVTMPGQADVVTIEGTAGAKVTLNGQARPLPNLRWQMTGPDGETVFDGKLPADEEQTIALPADGTFQLSADEEVKKKTAFDRHKGDLKRNVSLPLQILLVLGHPIIALLIAATAAMYFLGVRRGVRGNALMELATKSLGPAGIIILITGAGGVYKQMLISTNVGDALAEVLKGSGLGPLLLAWILTTIIRIAQGSATVAMVTGAALISPFLAAGDYSTAQLALVTIAIAAGATGFGHVNDSGFWIVNRYFRMTERETLLTWTPILTVISIVGLLISLLLWQFV